MCRHLTVAENMFLGREKRQGFVLSDAEMEKEALERVNRLDIGPQGFGGVTTALGVSIETAPTHIAGLPVAVNVGCHVTRHCSRTL